MNGLLIPYSLEAEHVGNVKYKAGIKKRQNQYKSNRMLKKDKVSIIVGQSQY